MLCDNSGAPGQTCCTLSRSHSTAVQYSPTLTPVFKYIDIPATPLPPAPYYVYTASVRAMLGRARRCQRGDGGGAARAAGNRDGGNGGRGRCDMAGKSGLAFTWRAPFVASSIHLGVVLLVSTCVLFCFSCTSYTPSYSIILQSGGTCIIFTWYSFLVLYVVYTRYLFSQQILL